MSLRLLQVTAVSAAVFFFPPSFASSSSSPGGSAAWDAFMGKVAGNQTTVNFGSGGQPVVTSSAGLGNPAIGNMGLAQSGKTVQVSGNIKAPLGDTGKAVGAVAKSAVARGVFMRGLGAAVGGVGGVALLALPYAMDWINSSGKYRVNPSNGEIEAQSNADGGYQYRLLIQTYENDRWVTHFTGWTTRAGACNEMMAIITPGNPDHILSVASSDPECRIRRDPKPGKGWAPDATFGYDRRTATALEWYPASMDDIAPYMDTPDAPALTPNIVYEGFTKAGINPFFVHDGQKIISSPGISGPPSVQGTKTQTTTQTKVLPGTTTEAAPGYSGETQPATKETVKTGTHNVVYDGNKITYNTINNTTTNITNNVTNITDTKTETEKIEDDSKKEEEKPEFCEKNPESLICKKIELDTPEGEVKRETATITYSPEDLGLGAGSCPADRQIGDHTFSYASTCALLSSYGRALVLALSTMTALIIIFAGRADA